MTHFIELFTATEKIAAIMASIAAIVAAMRVSLKASKRVYNNISGHINRISNAISVVESMSLELRPNHGSSLRDSIDRIEKMLTMTILKHRAILQNLGSSSWEADGDGSFIWGSSEFLKLCGRSSDDLRSNGFAICISPEEREFVWGEWLAAMVDKRDFDLRFRIMNMSGAKICVHMTAYALKNSDEVLGYWISVKPICCRPGERCPDGECPHADGGAVDIDN